MVIVEFPSFTRAITALLSDDQYRDLQNALVDNPELGSLIPGTRGLRKVRWSMTGRGKRGGIRVIYYWWISGEKLLMLAAYPKNVQDDLTPVQKKILTRLVIEELENG